MPNDTMEQIAAITARRRAILDQILVVDALLLFPRRIEVEQSVAGTAAATIFVAREQRVDEGVDQRKLVALIDLERSDGDIALASSKEFDGSTIFRIDIELPVHFRSVSTTDDAISGARGCDLDVATDRFRFLEKLVGPWRGQSAFGITHVIDVDSRDFTFKQREAEALHALRKHQFERSVEGTPRLGLVRFCVLAGIAYLEERLGPRLRTILVSAQFPFPDHPTI